MKKVKKGPVALAKVSSGLKTVILSLIRLYQATVSPDHGWLSFMYPQGYCRFHPSCSEYGYQAVAKKGAFKGTAMAVWRVLRCNPWSRGGLDPVE